MDFLDLTEELRKKLISSYDIYDNFEVRDQNFNLFAKYFMRSERYIAVRKAVIYGVETHDHLFLKKLDRIQREEVDFYLDWIKENLEAIVKPHEEHMSSTISLILVSEAPLDNSLEKYVKKIKYYKSFAWGFKGWVDLRLVIYSLKEKRIITNRKGREVIELFDF